MLTRKNLPTHLDFRATIGRKRALKIVRNPYDLLDPFHGEDPFIADWQLNPAKLKGGNQAECLSETIR